MVRTSDGSFSGTGGHSRAAHRDAVLRILRDIDLDRDDLLRLGESVQSALKSQEPRQASIAVREALAMAPGLAERWKPQTPADRYAFLQALLAAIALLLVLRPAPQATVTNNTIIHNVTIVQQDEPRKIGKGPHSPGGQEHQQHGK